MSNNSAEYADLKVAWHIDRIADLRANRVTVPPHLQLIISDLCSHDCPWCAYRMTGYASNQHFGEVRADGTINHNPTRFIPYEKAIEILDDAKALGVQSVEFTGGGEPTVHPRHAEIFRHALDIGLHCALVSNGTHVTDDLLSILHRFDWIRFSMDAGTAETYAAVRNIKPSFFGKFIANASLVSERLSRTGARTTFGISFVVLKENHTEIRQAARIARECGASYIRFAALFSPELHDYYSEMVERHSNENIAEAIAENTHPAFRIINMFAQRTADLAQGRPDYSFCGYQHMNMYIGGDLQVYRCCNTAYNDLGHVGDLKNQSLMEYMQSEARTKAYVEFNAHACKHCAFNGKNRVLNYMVNPHPTHVEFA